MLIGNRLLVCCVLTLVVVLGRFFATDTDAQNQLPTVFEVPCAVA